jgi:lipid II:glycine glycyltransferase (peptidoglycan interpeptide bridge formation enzyme)
MAPLVEKAPLSVLDEGDELFQSEYWAAAKARFGWEPRAFKVTRGNDAYPLLILLRRIAPMFTLGYVPYGPPGPGAGFEAKKGLVSLARSLFPLLPRHVRFLRFDLPWQETICEAGAYPPIETGYSLKKADMDIQPPNTVILDLAQGEQALLAGMKHKTRYNIRLSEKKGVTVEERDIRSLEEWYGLYRETAARDKIVLHSFSYYRNLFDLAASFRGRGPDLKLYMAYGGGESLGGIIVAHYRKKALYMYGASSNAKRNWMPNYALQWQAIRKAMEAGCAAYDFFGIPLVNDPSDPMYGLYRFKTGFGGRIIARPGCYDAPRDPIPYRVYSLAEKARRFYYKTLRKKI